MAELISVDVRFPSPEPGGSQTLLVTGYIQPVDLISYPQEFLENYMQIQITERLLQKYPDLQPLIDLTVIEPVSFPPKPQ